MLRDLIGQRNRPVPGLPQQEANEGVPQVFTVHVLVPLGQFEAVKIDFGTPFAHNLKARRQEKLNPLGSLESIDVLHLVLSNDFPKPFRKLQVSLGVSARIVLGEVVADVDAM
jgi:hypothetical protein